MKRRFVLSLSGGVALGAAMPAFAQTHRVMRVGLLGGYATPMDEAALRLALSQHGWEVGRNLIIEYRYARDDIKRYPSLAKELVDLRVDLIMANGDFAAAAAFNATRSIPIVAIATDPVEQGLAQSLARPGGNVTGMVYQVQDYAGKELDILRAIQPGLKRMGIVFVDSFPFRPWIAGWQAAADKTGVTMVKLPWPPRVSDIDVTLAVARRERVQAVEFGLNPALIGAGWQQINAWAIENKVLTKGSARSEAAVAFGADASNMLSQFAVQVDRLLRGANPAELPIQQPTLFDLIINRKIVHAIGLTVPRSVLVQATEVID